MKGIVFTEFLEFVSSRHGDDMVDDIIDANPLASGGAYTAVGTYAHGEMVALCTSLAERTGQPAGDVIRAFGTRLSESFARDHPAFFRQATSYFDFLASVEGHIHVEVRKLYPDAELPSFDVTERTATRMVMEYRSPRRMGPLAEGLIAGSARQFGITARRSPCSSRPSGSRSIVVRHTTGGCARP